MRRSSGARPIDAATIVFLRPGPARPEVLLTRRPASMAFAAGLHVFPGGRVEDADGSPELAVRSGLARGEAADRLGAAVEPARALALHVAAIREAFEETGILVAEPTSRPLPSFSASHDGDFGRFVERLGLRLRADALVPIARWVTPAFMATRFDTWFFAAELPQGANPRFDEAEVVEHAWLAPGRALDLIAEGSVHAWPPTVMTLAWLEDARDIGDVRRRLAIGPAAPLRIDEPVQGIMRFACGAAGGVPGREVNTYLLGHRELVVVDPGDPDERVTDAIADAIAARGEAAGIVLTVGTPDHLAGCLALAGRLGLELGGPGGHGAPGGLSVGGPSGARRLLVADVAELRDGALLPFGDAAAY
ncbi:MAG TPA: hypothetical protein VIV06_04480, partial [Candidatus Limnocylindrales bacterium]